MNSRLPGFYRLSPAERLEALHLDPPLAEAIRGPGLGLCEADLMVENVVGTFTLPNAVAVNFLINGEDRLIPMVVEEPSVVAAVSNMARLCRDAGGFEADSDRANTIGQVQLERVTDVAGTVLRLKEELPILRGIAEAVHPRLRERHGGVQELEVRVVRYEEPGQEPEDMVVLHVVLDCVDAMGANLVNTVCETLAPHVERVTGGNVGLRILSNLASKRLARARVSLPFDVLAQGEISGRDVAIGIASAWRFAWADPWRAATHNKGVMNGIDAVALATGNDWRAIEAGAHAWCCRDGQYRPMTRWQIEGERLIGSIELPMQFGTVGGPIRIHPTVQANLKVMGCRGARDLQGVAVAVGLSQNLGALRALATEGIQAGHMRMHARSVAGTAGARGDELPVVIAALCAEKNFSVDRARDVLEGLRAQRSAG